MTDAAAAVSETADGVRGDAVNARAYTAIFAYVQRILSRTSDFHYLKLDHNPDISYPEEEDLEEDAEDEEEDEGDEDPSEMDEDEDEDEPGGHGEDAPTKKAAAAMSVGCFHVTSSAGGRLIYFNRAT
eukprot:4149219-Pyramimonas_sp.AAC.1